MITAYPVAGKAKSYEICEAFVQGCGGAICTTGGLRDGKAFFYGVGKNNLDIWRQVAANGDREFYYCDNSYFDETRQEYFRVTKNRLQHNGYGKSDGVRFNRLQLKIKPWSVEGRHIVVCPQSDQFMHDVVGYEGDWTRDVIAHLKRRAPRREVRIREWSRDKAALSATLKEDLQNAYCLVTWSSAAAVTAVMEGVPAFCESMDCIVRPMAGNFEELTPVHVQRDNWLGVVADNQWTLDEFRNGTAWRGLCNDRP